MARTKSQPRRRLESHYLTYLRELRGQQWINTKKIKETSRLLREERRREKRECQWMRHEDGLSRRLRSIKYFKECYICMNDKPLRQFSLQCKQCTFDMCMSCRVHVAKCPQCRLELPISARYVDLTVD